MGTTVPGNARVRFSWRRNAQRGLFVLLVAALLLTERHALGERNSFRLAAGWTPVLSGAALRKLSFGYDRVVADVLWVKSLQYYGKQRLARAPMPRFKEYVDATVALDPLFVAAYVFGGLVLVEDLNRPDDGVDLLLRGIAANPERWELPFELGFLLYIDLDQPRRAGAYFEAAAAREGCPEMAKRFAAWTYAEGGNRERSRKICEEILALSGNEGMKAFAREALERIRVEDDLETIRGAIERFRGREGRLPPSLEALVKSGDLGSVPPEPGGGFYAYRPDTGEVDSSERIQKALDRHYKELEDALARYKANSGKYPDRLDRLVTEGFVPELRTIFGYRFAYDPESGRIWAVDVRGT